MFWLVHLRAMHIGINYHFVLFPCRTKHDEEILSYHAKFNIKLLSKSSLFVPWGPTMFVYQTSTRGCSITLLNEHVQFDLRYCSPVAD